MMKPSPLEPSENPTFSFPHPPQRRPLRSETYCTLVRILSHCSAFQSQQLPKQRETADRYGTGGCLSMESVLQNSVVPQELRADFVDGDVHETPKEAKHSDSADIVIENRKVGDCNGVKSVASLEENNAHINSVPNAADKEKVSCTLVGCERIMQQKVDKLPILHDFDDPIGSCLNTDISIELSTPVQHGVETNFKEVKNLSVELRMKEKELEKLIYASAAVDSSLCLAAADDIEEGEISGDGVPSEAMDFLFDDAVSLEEGKVGEGHGCENQNGENGLCNDEMLISLSLDEVHNCNAMLEKKSAIMHLDTTKEVFTGRKKLEISKAAKPETALQIGQILDQVSEGKYTGNLTSVAKELDPHGKIISKNTTEDKDIVTDEKEVCVGEKEKKKKRHPISKERKAKKKQKERIKRAEKNRKLGVKRLKLQPVLKSKKVTFCRHYLKGRCQEGEKCKFSHDTTPLTKSMPCCHFARHSCMKGDDCPYDHQLSKYPCNNYVNNGFCGRGADCLFSHEISVKGGSSNTSNICKADMKSPLQNNDLNSEKQMKLHGITQQQFDANSNSMGKYTGRSSERIVAQDPQRTAAVPKGISMISFVGSSSDGKHDKSPMPVKGNVDNLDQEPCVNSLNMVQKSNEVSNRVPLRSKGINFLSFGKAPLNASQIDSNHGVGESLLGELSRCNVFDLPSSSHRASKFGSAHVQSSFDIEPSKKETANVISDVCTPQGIKLLSLGKVSGDSVAALGVGQSGLSPNSLNKALPCSQGREDTSGGPKFSSDMPQGLACSSNPFSLCSDMFGTGISAGMSSSLKELLPSNAPKTALNALNSTLAFAAKFDSQIKLDFTVSSKITTQAGSKEGRYL